MEKKEIVKLFLRSKVLLRAEDVEYLERLGDAVIGEIAASSSPKEEILRRMTAPKFDVIKNLAAKPDKITPELQNSFFNSRYEQMKAIIGSRISRNWVSINRLPSRGDVFITGVVRDIREGEKTIIELEDPTGSVSVQFSSKPDIGLDEFAAVRANIVGRAVFGKETLYPDIPIRSATKGNGRGCFISDLHLDTAPASDARRLMAAVAAENVDWVFVAGDTADIGLFEELAGSTPTFLIPGNKDTDDKYPRLPLKTKRYNIVSLSDPAAIRIGGLVVLLCHKFDAEMLRKRHLGPSEEVLEHDYLVLDFVPDIVGHGHTHKPFVNNYKSTTLVNAGSLLTQASPVVVNFQTRDWKQLKI